MSEATLRRARPDEAEEITRLCRRSKRLWGYSDAFMERVAGDTAITATDIATDHVEVLELGPRLIGFYRLRRRIDSAWLEDLFIEPDVTGSGHGRRLLERAMLVARSWEYETLELDSDPNAEGFYEHLGAVRIELIDSIRVPGRRLPRMRLRL